MRNKAKGIKKRNKHTKYRAAQWFARKMKEAKK
jgi:hypothetical protein